MIDGEKAAANRVMTIYRSIPSHENEGCPAYTL